MRTDAGNLGWHVEHRVRHLTGHHIDLVGQCDGDDHIRFVCARSRKHIGLRPVTDKSPHIKCVAHDLDMACGCVDDRDVVLFGGKPLGDAVSDLPCSANDYPHDCSVRDNESISSKSAKRFCVG